jgi:copper transport protein
MLCGVVPQVHAHAHLRHSSPAEGAVLSVAPTQVTLTLSEPARLTAAWIQRGDEPRRKLAPPQQAAPEVSLALPALVPGEYLVSWRALSADGHVTSGSLHFKLASPGGPAHP